MYATSKYMNVQRTIVFVLIFILAILIIFKVSKEGYKGWERKMVSNRLQVPPTTRLPILRDMLSKTMSLATKKGRKPFLVYGNLLGGIRSGKMICYDYDVDLGIMEDEFDGFTEEMLEYWNGQDGYHADIKGFKGLSIILQVHHNATNLNLDLTRFIEKNGRLRRDVNAIYSLFILDECSSTYPMDWFFPLKKGYLDNIGVFYPRDSHSYLRCIYGDDYMVPSKVCDENCENCESRSHS